MSYQSIIDASKSNNHLIHKSFYVSQCERWLNIAEWELERGCRFLAKKASESAAAFRELTLLAIKAEAERNFCCEFAESSLPCACDLEVMGTAKTLLWQGDACR